MSHVMTTAAAARTRRAGRALGEVLAAGDVVTLAGDLGAGKTVLAKGVAEGLGVAGEVTSPTFNILLVHAGRIELAHFDLYRLEHAAQLEDIDFWGVLESGAASLIEWGDRFPGELPEDVLTITLSITGQQVPRMEIEGSGPRSHTVADAWVTACGSLDGVTIEAPGARP